MDIEKLFGPHIYGKTIGEVWLGLVKYIVEKGEPMPDEQRFRLACQNVRIKSETQIFPDPLIAKYGNKKNLEEILALTFLREKMRDCDVNPSFSDGPKSYYARLKEGRILEYIIDRLGFIPESKKGVIVFPEWKDYERVLENQLDDYFPCLIAIQYRMIEQKDGWLMNTFFYSRGIDAYQKAHGNLAAIAILSNKLAPKISQKLQETVKVGFLDGYIMDAHIYGETIDGAKELLRKV